jgi:hypothetical protein
MKKRWGAFCVTGPGGAGRGRRAVEVLIVARSVMNRQGSARTREPSVQGTLGVAKPTRKRKETLVEHQQQYLSIDLHRRRSVIVRITEKGDVLSTVQIENDPIALSLAIAEGRPGSGGGLGEHLRVVLGGRSALGRRGPGAYGAPVGIALGRGLHTASLMFGREVLDLSWPLILIWDEVAIRRWHSAWVASSKLMSQRPQGPLRAGMYRCSIQ